MAVRPAVCRGLVPIPDGSAVPAVPPFGPVGLPQAGRSSMPAIAAAAQPIQRRVDDATVNLHLNNRARSHHLQIRTTNEAPYEHL
jgi:hypothetical protein